MSVRKASRAGFVETKSFLILANDSRSRQNKKNPEHPFVDLSK